MSDKFTQYQCTACKDMRKITISNDEHVTMVSKSPNGLVIYSDVHRCVDGVLGINNLQIDKDLAVRSFELLELPTQRKPTSVPGLPSPVSKPKEQSSNFNVTKMQENNGFRLIIKDGRIDSNIIVGRINPKVELAITSIESDHGTVILQYYHSEMMFTQNLEKLFNILVNTLEILPPIKIGLFIETLRYLHSIYRETPDSFHIKLLKTILTSHETYFMINEGDEPVKQRLQSMSHKYGDEVFHLMETLIFNLMQNPIMPLQHFASIKEISEKKDDMVYLIHLFLILEQEGIIIIDRPGIVED